MGDYRRQLCGAQMPSSFYDPSNEEGASARRMACDAALADLVEYMKEDGVRVAAFDATNSTKERRQHIMNVLNSSGLGAKKMFVESICDQEEVCTLWPLCASVDDDTVFFLTQKSLSHSFSLSIALIGEHSQGQVEYARLSRHGSGSGHARFQATTRELHESLRASGRFGWTPHQNHQQQAVYWYVR